MGESAGQTLVSTRREQQLEEHRRSFERLMLVGCIAWPPFALVDALGAKLNGRADVIPMLISVRAIAFIVALFVYATVRWSRPTARALVILDYLVFVLSGFFVSIISVPLGGLASRGVVGLLLVAVTRASLMPSHWRRTATVTVACAATWPATLALASLRMPEVRAQWASATALGDFTYGMLFTLGAVAICSAGSHMLWAARQQVHEARRLGNYRLKMRIGGGGNGDVWVARQDPLGRDVALKVLKDRGQLDEEKIRRFEREARAAASLRHPNTIRIIEFGASDDGVLFIAMELLDGLDIDALVEVAGALPPARVIKLARQACASLLEAHSAGIVHRDIKPGNFFVTHVGEDFDFLKLLDFGVAHVGEGGPSLTDSGILFGTPAYMPPEVCAGERASTRSDLYSLGAVIYYMLTGTPLFPDKTFAETVMSHISKVPDLPSVRLGKALPERLEKAVMRCLEKRRKNRYRSVAELDAELAACDDAGHWSREDAQAFWRGTRPSVTLRVRGAA